MRGKRMKTLSTGTMRTCMTSAGQAWATRESSPTACCRPGTLGLVRELLEARALHDHLAHQVHQQVEPVGLDAHRLGAAARGGRRRGRARRRGRPPASAAGSSRGLAAARRDRARAARLGASPWSPRRCSCRRPPERPPTACDDRVGLGVGGDPQQRGCRPSMSPRSMASTGGSACTIVAEAPRRGASSQEGAHGRHVDVGGQVDARRAPTCRPDAAAQAPLRRRPGRAATGARPAAAAPVQRRRGAPRARPGRSPPRRRTRSRRSSRSRQSRQAKSASSARARQPVVAAAQQPSSTFSISCVSAAMRRSPSSRTCP